MTRVHLTGAALAASLLMVGILSPAVASASTHADGTATSAHADGTSAFAHAAGTTAPSAPNPAPRLGTPVSLTVVGSSLQLLPSLLGDTNQVNRDLRR